MKNLALTLFAILAFALIVPSVAEATNGRAQVRSNGPRVGSRVNRFDRRDFERRNFDRFDRRNFDSRDFDRFGNRINRNFNRSDFREEFVVSTFIDGFGDKIGITNFGNRVLLQRNVRLSDSRFLGLNSRRVGGFNNRRASSIAERAIDRTADVLLFNAFLNSRRGR